MRNCVTVSALVLVLGCASAPEVLRQGAPAFTSRRAPDDAVRFIATSWTTRALEHVTVTPYEKGTLLTLGDHAFVAYVWAEDGKTLIRYNWPTSVHFDWMEKPLLALKNE